MSDPTATNAGDMLFVVGLMILLGIAVLVVALVVAWLIDYAVGVERIITWIGEICQ